MEPKEKKTPYKRIALALSLLALVVWGVLGAGTSLAWFTDSSPEVNNIFHFADFKLQVSHRLTDGSWEKVDSVTKIFNDEDIYEPGHIQVAYLKVENIGTRDFKFNTAVNVNGYTLATNVFGTQFSLQDYLKFGLITSDNEEEMKNRVPDRETAREIANKPLNNYSSEAKVLGVGKTAYVTLIVRMPEEVNNIANYRGDTKPEVELGIIVKAEQTVN